jgi:tRNA A-37 threonylcarbamoyl transferase component Bud32
VWASKVDLLSSIALGLERLHEKNLVHCDLHSGNILIDLHFDLFVDLGLCQLENDLILNTHEKIHKFYGSDIKRK